jgi:formamidopyrimidine-DNA glycosylase
MNKNDDNKDCVINFRVSRETYDKIKDKAQENRETMSNLVRKVIEDGVEIIDDLSRDFLGGQKKPRPIVSYARVTLAAEVKCANCQKIIKAGTTATAGYDEKGQISYFCPVCKK